MGGPISVQNRKCLNESKIPLNPCFKQDFSVGLDE